MIVEPKARPILAAALLWLIFGTAGCVQVNVDPNILFTEEYNKIKYAPSLPLSINDAEEIDVKTSGVSANILNTIPALYKKGISMGAKQITNIRVETTAKHEPFQKSYRRCHKEYRSVSERRCTTRYVSTPYQSCTGYGTSRRCSTSYRQVPRQDCKYVSVPKWVDRCQTYYRTEKHWVLYQQAKATVFNIEKPKTDGNTANKKPAS